MVGDDGRVYVGRGWTNEAAHTRSHNHLGYGICILGDYEIEAPSAKAMDVAYALVQCGIDKVNTKTGLPSHPNVGRDNPKRLTTSLKIEIRLKWGQNLNPSTIHGSHISSWESKGQSHP